MTFYCFKTKKASYFFPKLTKKSRFIYSLYGNYGGFLAKIYWWLFLHCSLVRCLNRVESSSVQDFELLQTLLGSGFIFGINFGTFSPDQKKSILGYDEAEHHFFAKLSKKENAKKLSSNEILVYQKLADTGLVPKLFDYKITDEYVFLKTECIEGNHVLENISNDQILQILETLRAYRYDETLKSDGLKTCFSHGDFCLWNMLESDGRLKIIDWEMAGERALGHDLFTYIFQTSFLLHRKKSFENVMRENKRLINSYFESACIDDWKPYFKDFVLLKIEEFTRKQDSYMLARYKEALNAKF